MGYVPLAIVFGFLFVQAGGAWWLALAASLVIYAGASQFAMIPMLAAGMPVASLALAALVINMRHAFYGLSLLENRPRHFLVRWYLVFALTDETYSVITSARPRPTPNAMAALAAINQGWWVIGTLIGAGLGAQVPVSLTGLDFALAALFAILVVEQWRASRTLLPLLVALASYALCTWVLPGHALLAAVCLSVIAGLCWPSIRARLA